MHVLQMPYRSLLVAMALFSGLFGFAESAKAVVISGELFTVGGTDSTIDTVFFDVTAGTTVNFDILAFESGVDLNADSELTRVDTQLNLFTSGNVQIALNDDGPLGGDGSITGLDSNFNFFFAAAGTHFITIGDLFYTTAEALAGLHLGDPGLWTTFCPGAFGCETDHADWQLTLTATNGTISNVFKVPEPGTFALFAIGLAGFGVIMRRRRRRQDRAA